MTTTKTTDHGRHWFTIGPCWRGAICEAWSLPRGRAATPFIPLARPAIAIRGLTVVDGRIAETDIVADQARLHR